MSRLRPHVKLTLRIYAERDADLYRWLQGLEDLPYGRKAQVVKEALRRGLKNANITPVSDGERARIDSTEIRQTVEKVLTEALADIRRVVEVAVATALKKEQAGGAMRPAETEQDAEDDRNASLLDSLEGRMVM